MYKHILVATDGSDAAERAMRDGFQLASVLGARLSVLTITKPWHAVAPGEVMVAFPEDEYLAGVQQLARTNLQTADKIAAEIGVTAETMHVVHDHIYEGIIEVAQKNGCDLIVMGSHGRSGLVRLFLGSETQKVLAHTRIPVLVHR